MTDSVILLAAAVAVVIALPSWAAYITMRRHESPSAVATMAVTQDEMAQQIRDLQQSEKENHRLILQLQSRMETQSVTIMLLSEHGQAMTAHAEALAARLRELGQQTPPAPRPPKLPEMQEPPVPVNRSALARRVGQQFSSEEINSLAYDIGVLADELDGRTRAARAESLVELSFRRGILFALARRVDELRPEGRN